MVFDDGGITVDVMGKYLLEVVQQDFAYLCTCIYFHSDFWLSGIGMEMKGCDEHCLSILCCICF